MYGLNFLWFPQIFCTSFPYPLENYVPNNFRGLVYYLHHQEDEQFRKWQFQFDTLLMVNMDHFSFWCYDHNNVTSSPNECENALKPKSMYIEGEIKVTISKCTHLAGQPLSSLYALYYSTVHVYATYVSCTGNGIQLWPARQHAWPSQ